MKTTFLLLNPVTPESFGITFDEFVDSLDEFGCKYEPSMTNLNGDPELVYFITATTKEALERMVNDTALEGNIIEVTAIYDAIED
jgi:hypothetical protein